MTRPELKVEIAFNAGYSTPAASRTWTDVTSYVLQMAGVAVDQGRRDEYSVAEMNSLSLTLNNTDGRFTPGLASSPYYPNVKLGRPVRVTSTPAGQAASVRFVGDVDTWPVEWPGVTDTYAECRITARSRMARLGRGIELRSIIEEEFLLDSPSVYYTLGEPEGSTAASDGSGNNLDRLTQAGTGAAVTFGTATGPGTDGLTAASFAGGKYLQGGLALTPESFSIAVTTPSTIPATTQTIFLLDGATDAVGLALIGTDGAGLGLTPGIVMLLNGGSSFVGTGPGASLCDGSVHLVTWRGIFGLYVDGALYDTPAYSMTTPSARLKLGRDVDGPFAGFVGAVAHLAFFASTLSAARVTAHADAALTGFAGETPAARLTRYAAFAGIPSAETSFETGDLPNLAHIDTTGKTALAVMREVELTEGGVLFDARDGTLAFHDRSHRYGTTAAVTLDMDAGEVAPAYAPSLDDVALRNDVTATGADGAAARVIDTGSVDDHGAYRMSLDLATTNPDEPFQAASWRVGNYADPAVRVSTLTVELARLSAVRQAAVLALAVGDKVTVTNLMGQSDTTSKTFYVEGYAETVGSATHAVAFNVSPATVSDVWILEDATYGVLGTTTRLGY